MGMVGDDPSRLGLDPLRLLSRKPKNNPYETCFGVSRGCLAGVYLNGALAEAIECQAGLAVVGVPACYRTGRDEIT